MRTLILLLAALAACSRQGETPPAASKAAAAAAAAPATPAANTSPEEVTDVPEHMLTTLALGGVTGELVVSATPAGGWRLDKVTDALRAMGFQDGDVVLTVDGQKLTRAGLPVSLAAARSAGTVVVRLERGGQVIAQAYHIDPGTDAPRVIKNLLGARRGPAGELLVPRARLQAAYAHPDIFRAARIVPSIKDGKPNGFKIYAIKPGSAYAQLGLSNGDAVVAVNGMAIDSMDGALTIAKKLENADRFEVDLIRRGAPAKLVIVLEGTGPGWIAPPSPVDPSPTLDGLPTPAVVGAPLAPPEPVPPSGPVDRALLDAAFSDPDHLGGAARSVPSVRDGKPEGVKLYGIKPSSWCAQIGLQNGDTIVSVNGQAITTFAELSEAWMKNRGRKGLHLALVRRGRAATVSVLLK